tara:strand:+ start:35 stop:649 length:615 start_codon:yes stop_codon:yes gene_type:complete
MIENREILKFFPQPIFKYKVQDYKQVNAQLSDYIYNLKRENEKGLDRTNVNGWHSQNFNLKDKKSIQYKFLISMKEYIFDVFNNYGWDIDPKKIVCTEMWAIINKKDSFNLIHTHPNSYLSAAYYVKAPENCGKFLVENPNSVSNHSYPKIYKETEFNANIRGLNVKEGDLLFFPSYLPHKVGRNMSNEDRIVISFNINVNHFI